MQKPWKRPWLKVKQPGTTEDVGDENMITLIRMCGSQLQGIYKKKLNERKRTRQENIVEEQLAIIYICMNQQGFGPGIPSHM